MEKAKETGSRGGTVERLTERNESGGITVKNLSAALEKLAELEDAEEDGRLARLPVKPGETVYTLASQSGPVLEWIIRGIYIDKSAPGDKPDIEVTFYTRRTDDKDDTNYFMSCDIGVTAFLTSKEAEAALKGRTG